MRELWRKLTGRMSEDRFDAELREEMETHLAMKAAETGDGGGARKQFGNTTLLIEDAREAWVWPWIEGWVRDFRLALRGLRKRPGFAATVVLTLAVGIGSSSTIFALIDTVLIRPLPYADAERLVMVEETKLGDPQSRTRVAPGRLEDWQALARSFAALTGVSADNVTDTTLAEPERLESASVSPRFFAALGVAPVEGRTFTAEEERFGGPAAVVISERLRRRRFPGKASVLGQRLVLGGKSYPIVGVMPAEFQFPAPSTDVWIAGQTPPALLAIREARVFLCVGRLRDGVTVEQAQTDLASVQARLGEEYPRTDAGWSVLVEPLKDRMVGKVRLGLMLLFGSAGMLLAITCANVACLMLARLNSRVGEMATRRSLGAGGARLARQLFAEGLIYAGVGGALGVGLALTGVDVLRRQLAAIPRIAELEVDGRMLAAAAAISLLAAVMFSLGPIVQMLRGSLSGSLIAGGRSLIGGRQRTPKVLVSGQLALATALLIAAGLFLQSMMRVEEAPLGFEPENVLSFRVVASFGEPPGETMQRHERIMEAVGSLPGVKDVAMSTGLPAVNAAWPREFEISGEPAPDGTIRFTTWRVVTTGYFRIMGIPVVEGRSCRMDTGDERPFEVLVNRTFADRYFPGRSPLGRTISGGVQGDITTEIVGVAADAREDGRASQVQPLIYLCGYLRYWQDSEYLIGTESTSAVAGAVRGAVRRLEPSRPVYAVQPVSEAIHGALSQTRFRALVVGLFSAMALGLAAIGLYGVMSYAVAERVREIGLRVALGARPSQIAGEVLRSGAVLAGAGIVFGILVAAAASKVVATQLYGIEASDVRTYVAAGVLFGVALFACIVPSQRAVAVNPTEALRPQ